MSDLAKAAQKAKEFRMREQEILNTALDLFLELGEDRVTVEMIAEKVGIGKGTIYKHFETKDEIYLLLMIRYEEELAHKFDEMNASDEKERLAKEYFAFRIKDPKRYMLFDRLERKLINNNTVPELLNRLHTIRASNFSKLNEIVTARIQEGIIEDVPPEYHVFAAWALAHGAVALKLNPFYYQMLEDPEDFFNFLVEIGVRMGNKGQYRK